MEEEKNTTYEEHPDYALFVCDTETTGQQGLPLFHKNNQILQIVICHLASQSWYKQICNPGDHIHITKTNTDCHKIGRFLIERFGIPLEDALMKFISFVNEKSDGKQVVIVTHNASFDMFMVLKGFIEYLRMYLGINSSNHKWLWLCSLESIRALHPELDRKFFPFERPYKLTHLMAHFFPDYNFTQAHNAQADVEALIMLLTDIILPELNRKYTSLLDCPYIINGRKKKAPRLELVSNVHGYGTHRTKILNSACNKFFQEMGSGYDNLRTPVPLFHCGYLWSYGYLNYMNLHDRLPASVKNLPYWGTCREIEVLLRINKIYSDNLIIPILANVCNVDQITFMYYVMRENGNKQFYPTMPGEPISYLPMELSARDAKNLYENLHFRTISDLVAAFIGTPETGIQMFIIGLNAQLSFRIHYEKLLEYQKDVLAYGGG